MGRHSLLLTADPIRFQICWNSRVIMGDISRIKQHLYRFTINYYRSRWNREESNPTDPLDYTYGEDTFTIRHQFIMIFNSIGIYCRLNPTQVLFIISTGFALTILINVKTVYASDWFWEQICKWQELSSRSLAPVVWLILIRHLRPTYFNLISPDQKLAYCQSDLNLGEVSKNQQKYRRECDNNEPRGGLSSHGREEMNNHSLQYGWISYSILSSQVSWRK